MSLIQEALRRKLQEEQGGNALPPDLPAMPVPVSGNRRRKALVFPFLAVLFMVASGSVAVVYLVRSARSISKSGVEAVLENRAPGAQKEAGRTQQDAKRVAPPAPSVSAARPAFGRPVRWPRLNVVGVMARSARGSAVVNGRIVEVGEDIERSVLVRVEPAGVTFAYLGETQYVRVGQSTR